MDRELPGWCINAGRLAFPEFREVFLMSTQGSPGLETTEAFVRRIALPFQNLSLLRRALTHRSYLNEHPEAVEDNERLEFLGDAVLDFLVGAWLYNHFPEMAEGELTRMRSALVRTEQLAEFATQIHLGDAMCLGHGEVEAGGRQRPALLCATFEALVGALYLSAGMSAVRGFVEPFLEGTAGNILAENKDQDAKSSLQEWVQSQGFGPPQYRTVSASGPDHAKMFEVEVIVDGTVQGRGAGHSKQTAAKAAAIDALHTLGVG
jgi:ribonuclease-3